LKGAAYHSGEPRAPCERQAGAPSKNRRRSWPADVAVAIAAGFSGHGFKFCSVVGDILADLALDGGTRHDISLFALARLPIAFQ